MGRRDYALICRDPRGGLKLLDRTACAWAGATPRILRVTPEEVGPYVESLPGVKRKGTGSRPAWYVHNRLVARVQDANTLVIRAEEAVRRAIGLAFEMQRHRPDP